ncbi:MAG TPA: multicopper oxidase domain-containing protein [Pseudolabrys sp.]|nr:multicopper oxidase domain-containing protein [Pseudolabrys sp.]
MLLSRRNIVLGASALVLGGALPRRAAAQSNPLKIPPLIDAKTGPAGKHFDLEVLSGTSNFLPDVSTPTLGINGPYLGPTIRARASERVSMRVKNGLSDETTLHWHGLHVPAIVDGGPHQVIKPGEVWEPSFTIKQKASLCWYHSHLMEQTGEQVLRGLAGLFLIDDDETAALRLPSDYGVDDIPLIIQDRRFNADGSFEYMSNMGDAELGYQGNIILVNGTVTPYLELKRRRTRLRVLNGSNARIYTLGRDDGVDLIVIGSDGSLLERPVRMRRVRLSPGERIEMLVDMQPDTAVKLMSYPLVAAGMGAAMGGGTGSMMMSGMGGNTETFPIIDLRAGKLEAAEAALPERLIAVPQWDPAKAARTRTFTLDMSTMSIGAMPGPRMDNSMGINGRSMDMARIDEKVPLGSVEIWDIRNATPLAHPFHIHDVQFHVLDRNGAPPLAHEQGLKDTVLIDPGSRVRIIAEFLDYADPDHPYMYHCHILEHEDAGMMGQFVVV